MRTIGRFLLTSILAAAGLAIAAIALARPVSAVFTAAQPGQSNKLEELEELAQRSIVYTRDGKTMAVLKAEENRSPVDLKQVPEHLINAVIAMEDERFWQHGGVDIRSTGRAMISNVEAGGLTQGGSTITQQLVKNTLVTPERSLGRKLKEAVLALRVEGELSKKEILEKYLNTVYFGSGAYGVQAASETYFGVDVEKVTVAQAALLAGIIRNPTGYEPFRNPVPASERRSLALDRMVEQGYLEQSEADELRDDPLPTSAHSLLPPPNDYFVEEVKQRLLDDPRLGETAQERYNAVFKGGLQIFTTMDPRMQSIGEEKVESILPGSKRGITAALVSLEPYTGAVRAMVGGPNFEQARYNLVTQGLRQPGSSWKPFVLMAAIEAGYGPRNTVNGTSPCPVRAGGRPWLPSNYGESTGGVASVTTALAKSYNCAFVRLGLKVGLDKVTEMARRLGITSPLDDVPAMTLGTEEVHPLDMASAYGTIANDGIRHKPYFVERVLDRNGKVIFEGPDAGEQVVDVNHARIATQMMRAVVSGGTGTRASVPGRQVAGKTGTSQNYENAWFVGFTPQLATAVWMGSPVGNVPMGGVTGGSYPAAIFGAYMRAALAGAPVENFKLPDPKSVPGGGFISDPPQARGRVGVCAPGVKPSKAAPCVSATSSTLAVDATVPTVVPPPQPTTTRPESTPTTAAGGDDGTTTTTGAGGDDGTTSTTDPPERSTTTTRPRNTSTTSRRG
ncbi:MAG TPA: PBP1A family penicillin-binding protein [Acidimicrobiales bacterium]|nr:PBP1A family penicillin-binding protein [Acidimicrobiales bacterium]